MRKIAVFTSSSGTCADRLVSLFNDGDRLHIDLIVSDSFDGTLADRFSSRGVEVAFFPGEDGSDELQALLKSKDIDLIAIDGFGKLPAVVESAYRGRIVTLTSEGEAAREIVAATAVPPLPKSVDEEWAETLHIDFDPSRMRQTPPPVPGHKEVGNVPPVPVMPPVADREPMPPTYLVWSIVMAVVCCTVPGIVAIIFSSMVSGKYAIGDIEGARRSSRNAEIWIIISFVLGIISAVFYLPIMMMI